MNDAIKSQQYQAFGGRPPSWFLEMQARLGVKNAALVRLVHQRNTPRPLCLPLAMPPEESNEAKERKERIRRKRRAQEERIAEANRQKIRRLWDELLQAVELSAQQECPGHLDDLQQAIEAIKCKSMGLRAAAKTYRILTTTLKDRLDNKNKYATECSKFLGRPPILPQNIEQELVQHILKSESMFLGFTRDSLMKLAFEVAARNGFPHVYNTVKKKAGKTWLKLFLRRHPEISLRQPEPTSLARATGFNKQSVGRFFDLLQKHIDLNGFTAVRIFNMDETAISTVRKRCQKVFARRGKHQIGSVSSGERGTNTTVVCCCSAAGQFVPPFILFKRKRMNDQLRNGASAGSLVTNNETGWMDRDMFFLWLKHFAATVKPTCENKVLLILDGAVCHTRSLAAIEYAREQGIDIISLPPHTTHKLQPLDVAFFKPLQTFYIQEQEMWMRTNPGRQITVPEHGNFHLPNLAQEKASELSILLTSMQLAAFKGGVFIGGCEQMVLNTLFQARSEPCEMSVLSQEIIEAEGEVQNSQTGRFVWTHAAILLLIAKHGNKIELSIEEGRSMEYDSEDAARTWL